MSSNYKSIATPYTKDAKIFPNKIDILEGIAIQKYWTIPKGISILTSQNFTE